MQSLKAIGLVDGVPGPKGGYIPTQLAYKELNLSVSEGDYDVPISRNGEKIKGAHVQEIDFTTLCHPDICHAVIKLVGSVKIFDIGDKITIGPTPVNKLLIRGEVFGKDESTQSLLIATSEMISLPKQPIKAYMSTPLKTLSVTQTIRDAVSLFSLYRIHGAPVLDGNRLAGIVTMSDVAKALDRGLSLDDTLPSIMTKDVIQAPSDIKLFDVIGRFKEREIGRLVVTENGKPVGILTQSDIIRVFPSV